MILTKEFKTRLMALKSAGKKAQYNQAWAVLGELESGAPVSKNFRPDSRIPNCYKYELPDGYRIILQQVENVENEFLALFVGSHDDTDHFLNTHKDWIFDPNRHTLKELRWNTAAEEAVNSVRSPEMKAAQSEKPSAEAVFSRLTDAQLVKAGLSAEDLSLARSLSDPDSIEMMRFLERIPKRASDILLAYVTGSRAQRDEIEALLLNERELVPALGSPQMPALASCTDTFIFLRDVPEEKRAFEELPFEDWMLYLHPDQRTLVAREFSGPARLRGVSGSGKTVVAIHRARAAARALVDCASPKFVLFLTYNRSLCEIVGHLLQRLCTKQEFERIQVATLGKWCQDYIRFRTDAPAAWRDEIVEEAWARVLQRFLPRLHQANFCMHIATAAAISSKDPDVLFLSDEMDFIFGKFLHRDADSYLTVERLGRGRRLGPNQRTLILDIYKNFVAELAKLKQFDAREQARISCSLLENGEQSKIDYAAVVVDEIQDLSDIDLRIVKAIGEAAGSLFLVGDGAQQIYKRGQSLKSIGLNVSGRSSILHKNYRNTREIIAAAMALKNAEGIGRFDEDPDASQLDAIPSAMSGERPSVLICPDLQKELELVAREIKYLTSKLGFSPVQICCMSRAPLIRNRLLKHLEVAGLKALDYRADGVGADDAVLVSTLHSAKGHEFRAVFILGLYEGALPLYSAAEDEDVEREAALLYVAMTRAKELLYLSYSTCDLNNKPLKQSRFLKDMWTYLDVLDFTTTQAHA
jgi:superfamily I DNA/RNA helicase